MFSGLIQQVGRVQAHKPPLITVQTRGLKPRKGDSIAINGVCLTVTDMKTAGKKKDLTFAVSDETYDKTTMKGLKPGAPVNVEPALTLKDSLGGHIVQGHVDGTGQVRKIIKKGSDCTIWFNAPEHILKYMVYKGSVTVDGVSLTVAQKDRMGFAVALIPYTLTHTQLQFLTQGQKVNLEADIFAKYVAAYLKKQ